MNAFSLYGRCDTGANVSRSAGMAEDPPVRTRGLRLHRSVPKHETYGLAPQMRRAAVSIPANIAEAFRRRGRADKARFLNMAEGSVEECRYLLILTKGLGYAEAENLSAALEEVSRLFHA